MQPSDYWDVLIRRWKWIAAMVILGAAAAAAAAVVVKPVYEATAVVALAPATLSVPTANQAPPYYLLVDSPRKLPVSFTPAYYVTLLKSDQVTRPPLPSGFTAVVAPNSGDKSLIEITVRGEDAAQAAGIANTRAQSGADRIRRALTPTGAESSAAQKLLSESEQALVKFGRDNGLGEYDLARLRSNNTLPTEKKLELARLLRAYDVTESVYLAAARELEQQTLLVEGDYQPKVISTVVPTEPVTPKWAQNTAAGAVLGLLFGVLGAFALEYASRGPKNRAAGVSGR